MCGVPVTVVGVYAIVTVQEPPESVQIVGLKLPAPLVVKVPTVPVGVGLEGVTVTVQVDADPTVTGLVQATVVVLTVSANAGRMETARNTTAKTNARDIAIEPILMPISYPHLPSQSLQVKDVPSRGISSQMFASILLRSLPSMSLRSANEGGFAEQRSNSDSEWRITECGGARRACSEGVWHV
jgi:hypothetical protein